MKANRIFLTITLLSLALVVILFSATDFATAPIWLLFQKAAGLETAKTIAHAAAWLTTMCLFIAGALVAIPTALQPARWFHKSINVLPAYLLGLTFAAVIANVLGIATLGSILSAQSTLKVSLATAWLGVGAVLTTIAVVIAVARVNLSSKILKTVIASTAIALVPALILSLAMLGSIYIVATNQSGLPSDGGLAGLVTQFEIGGGLMLVCAVIALVGVAMGVRARRGLAIDARAAAAPPARPDIRREAMRALVCCAAISAVAFVAIQLVPISRDNPRSSAQCSGTRRRQKIWSLERA
jgi:hypothetical protein